MTKQRIAIFLPSLAGGGAERSMVRLANALVEHHVPVDMVVASAVGPLLCELSPECRLSDLRSGRVSASLPALARYLRREQPFALISAMGHANVAAIWARRLANVSTRVVVSERSPLLRPGDRSASRRSLVMKSMTRRMMKLSYRKADAVVAVSTGVADQLSSVLGLARETIDVIYNPVVSQAMFAGAQEPLGEEWINGDGRPLLLAVGRLTMVKDFDTLIRAFAVLRGQRPCRLMILGEGEDRPTLQALIGELGLDSDVALPGFRPNPYAFMKRADLFVQSSRWEGLGNALIEAMALGTPVVATDCPTGPREILEDGRWGRLVPVGDVEGLAAAMSEALNAPGHSPGPRGLEFTVDRAVRQYARVAGLAPMVRS